MKKEQETSEEKNEEITDSTDKATAPSTAFPDLTEKHPCPPPLLRPVGRIKNDSRPLRPFTLLLHLSRIVRQPLRHVPRPPALRLLPVRPRADTAAPTPRIPLETDKEVPCLAPARISQKKEKSIIP